MVVLAQREVILLYVKVFLQEIHAVVCLTDVNDKGCRHSGWCALYHLLETTAYQLPYYCINNNVSSYFAIFSHSQYH